MSFHNTIMEVLNTRKSTSTLSLILFFCLGFILTRFGLEQILTIIKYPQELIHIYWLYIFPVLSLLLLISFIYLYKNVENAKIQLIKSPIKTYLSIFIGSPLIVIVVSYASYNLFAYLISNEPHSEVAKYERSSSGTPISCRKYYLKLENGRKENICARSIELIGQIKPGNNVILHGRRSWAGFMVEAIEDVSNKSLKNGTAQSTTP